MSVQLRIGRETAWALLATKWTVTNTVKENELVLIKAIKVYLRSVSIGYNRLFCGVCSIHLSDELVNKTVMVMSGNNYEIQIYY